MYLVIYFGFEDRIWVLIVSVPDHCLSFYFNSLHADRARCIPQGRRFRDRIPKLSHPHTASLSLGTTFSSPILTNITQSLRQASLAYILPGSVSSRKVENSEAASVNSVSHCLYYRHFLATGPNFEPLSDPLKTSD